MAVPGLHNTKSGSAMWWEEFLSAGRLLLLFLHFTLLLGVQSELLCVQLMGICKFNSSSQNGSVVHCCWQTSSQPRLVGQLMHIHVSNAAQCKTVLVKMVVPSARNH